MVKRLLICRLIILILFVVGIGMIFGGIRGLSNVNKIDKEYVSTMAKIENIQEQRKRRHGKVRTHHDVTVSYMVNGKRYTEKLNAYSSFMQVGDSIQLKYNPQRSGEIRSTEIEHLIFIVIIFVGAIFLILCLFMPCLFRKLKTVDS